MSQLPSPVEGLVFRMQTLINVICAELITLEVPAGCDSLSLNQPPSHPNLTYKTQPIDKLALTPKVCVYMDYP